MWGRGWCGFGKGGKAVSTLAPFDKGAKSVVRGEG